MSAPDPVQQGEGHIAKADGKAAVVGALAGTMLAVTAGALSLATLPGPVRIGGWTLVVVWLVAVDLLLLELRPNLAGDFGIVRWSRMTTNEIRRDLDALGHDPIRDTEARTVGWLSRAAVAKYGRVRLAIDALIAAPGIALAAGVIAWLL